MKGVINVSMDDEYFEFLLKKASDSYCREQGRKYIEEFGNAQKAEHSKEYINNMRKMSKKYGKRKFKPYYKAAAVILIFFTVGITTVYNADAYKLKFITQFFKTDDKSIDISTKENPLEYDIDELPEGWDYIYLPQSVPVGFRVDEIELYDDSVNITYCRGEDYIWFNQYNSIGGNISVDNERHTMEKVRINNNEAYLFEGENDSILEWSDEEYMLAVSGNLTKDEVIAFAESLERY